MSTHANGIRNNLSAVQIAMHFSFTVPREIDIPGDGFNIYQRKFSILNLCAHYNFYGLECDMVYVLGLISRTPEN